ncbi:asparaginase [Clostridium sp.]|uniref:asparaginase n=1 Tax=Clostridium sp. TaxID=1506 RepID=UPI001A45E1D3|nr:asparaginase [Clostridium sp.]MBK5236272.1 asparaginase [Clostridium sp.]
MKKILLIGTGGTIACSTSKDGLSPHYNIKELLNYVPEVRKLCDISGQLIMNIDSTNINPDHWIHIAKTIYENYNDYDGFVVTHGTDTMAYTSCALSYILQNLGKPIVLTGAQHSIESIGTDAKQNLSDAVTFAIEDVAGVFVAFDGKIISGTRSKKVKTKSLDAFSSVNFPYIAYVKHGVVTYNEDILKFLQPSTNKEPQFDFSLCTSIIILKLFPGINPKIFDFIKKEYKGVIIESFGIGGIPFKDYDIISKIKELTENGIAVIVTTQCQEEGIDLDIYEVGKKLAKTKIIYAQDMNIEAITAKLMWAIGKSQNLDEIKKLIETPIMNDLVLRIQ